MASTSYKARVIYKEHSEDGFAGSYKLMVAAKSISAPVSAPNTVESTTFEDDSQTFLMGIKTSDAKTYTGNLEKAYLQDLIKAEGKQLDIIQLYGSDGLGAVGQRHCPSYQRISSGSRKEYTRRGGKGNTATHLRQSLLANGPLCRSTNGLC